MKRALLIILAVLILTVVATLIGGPYYVKSYLEDNGKELVGRKIAMDRLRFNALNGHLLVVNFKLFEADNTEEFVQFDTLYVNMALYKILSGHVWSDAVHLKGLDVAILKNGDQFNFSDLIPESDSSAVDSVADDKGGFISQFTFNDIQILNSSVAYADFDLDTKHDMQDINIKLPGITIGDKQTTAGLEFAFANGGTFRTNLDYNLVDNAYSWDLEIDQLNLNPFTPYAQKGLNISNLQGWFTGDVLIVGDIDEPSIPIISGNMNLNDFSLTDLNGEEVIGFSSVFMDAEELNVGTRNYHFGKLNINRPFVNGIVDADGDNLRRLAKKVEKATDTIVQIERDPVEKTPITYLLDEFRLNDGELNLKDISLESGVFKYSIQQLNFAADDLTEGKMVTFEMDAVMNGKGKLTGHVVTDPGNPGNGTFDFALKNTLLKDFSRYCEDATGFPITDGRMSFQTENKIVSNHLNSHLVLNMFNTELANKRKDLEPDVNVPMKLGLVVLEDTKGRINIDVPAEGDIDDPEFRYSKLVWKVVLNVLVKAATSPYNLLAKSMGVDEDQLAFIRMEMLQEELGPEQTAQLDLLANLLNTKPSIKLTATLNVNEKAEGDVIRNYIARKGYWLQKEYGSDSARADVSAVDKIKIMEIVEDEAFDAFLAQKLGVSVETTKRKELVKLYASNEEVAAEQERLNKKRIGMMSTYLARRPDINSRFAISQEKTSEDGKRRPRFNLTYDIQAEEE